MRAFNTDAIKGTENPFYNSADSMPFEKHCNDIFRFLRLENTINFLLSLL